MALAKDESISEAERQQLLERAVKINLPIADSLARRYRSRGEDLDDLVQVARIGLMHAVHRYQPENGAFLPFAVPTITGELKRHFRDHCWTVRPPRRLQELHSEVTAAWSELAQLQSASPTVDQIAAWLGADRTEVLEAMRSNAFSSASLDTTDGIARASAVIGTTDPGFEEVEDGEERRQQLREVQGACERLSVQDRELLRMRFEDGSSQSAIAAELGISQMSVSRRLRKVTRNLRLDITRHRSRTPGARLRRDGTAKNGT
ncbi:MAG: sigma-70 family RNA polymerase sigma factor [Microlunatus sp.]|nr:sigma-70 family RNA polymerase sigma factor [Microlunatus sp.]